MRTLLKVGFGLLLLSFVLIGMSFTMLRAQGTSNRGSVEGRNVATETRTVGAEVTKIDLSGPIDMTLRQGAIASLTVRGEKRLLGNIDTTQDGKTLRIGTKGMLLHHRQPLQVVLTLPSIDKLNIRGSGDSTINGFSGDKVDVQLYGSGNVKFNGRYKDVTAAVHGSGDMEMNGGSSDKVDVALVGSGQMTVVGSCKQFNAEQTGSGDLDAEHLAADATAVKLHGSGTSVVQALKTVDVTVRGSGDVSVLGNPTERTVNKTGSGDVVFRE
ncbi:MAG: head GIN domain-containing protein [Pseudomonadota bacterium]